MTPRTPVGVMCDVTPKQLKRKRTSSTSSDVDDTDRHATDCDDQRLRRRVIELSLAKVCTAAPLTRSLRRREPPLLRSVLIINTLRAVDADRVFADPTLCGAVAVAPSTPYRAPSVLDELPGSLLRPPAAVDPLADHRAADDASISAILDDLFGSERTSGAFQTAPVLTFSSLFDLDVASVWPPLSAAAVTSPSASSPASIDVDLDLDATMFDFDLLQPLTPAAAWCAGSRTAVSTPAALGGASSVLMTSAYAQRGQGFVDELEHIAEVLVGT